MIVKFYNYWTTHETHLKFPKGTKKKKRDKVRKDWLAEDLDWGKNWREYDEAVEEVNECFGASEETIVRAKKVV